MKLRFPSIMAVVLALVLVNAGFARAQLLLCRYQCEQDRQVHISPCCSSSSAHHSDDQRQAPPAEDCPHVDGNQNASDFSFTIPCTRVPPPASFAVAIFSPVRLLPAAAELGSTLHSGTSPPGIVPPPRYHLYCSLLI